VKLLQNVLGDYSFFDSHCMLIKNNSLALWQLYSKNLYSSNYAPKSLSYGPETDECVSATGNSSSVQTVSCSQIYYNHLITATIAISTGFVYMAQLTECVESSVSMAATTLQKTLTVIRKFLQSIMQQWHEDEAWYL